MRIVGRLILGSFLVPPHMFERAIAIRDDGQQTLAIFGRWKDTDGLSHPDRPAHPPDLVNHPSVSVH